MSRSITETVPWANIWFSGHNLLIATFTENSGSIRPLVNDVTENTVKIEEHFPPLGSQDMAAWNILITVDKSMMLSDEIGMTFTPVLMDSY